MRSEQSRDYQRVVDCHSERDHVKKEAIEQAVESARPEMGGGSESEEEEMRAKLKGTLLMARSKGGDMGMRKPQSVVLSEQEGDEGGDEDGGAEDT